MNTNKESRSSGRSLSHRIRASLVLKLNLHMLARLLSAFIFLNLLSSTLIFGAVIWRVEEGVQHLLATMSFGVEEVEMRQFAALGYRMAVGEEARGATIPQSLGDWLPLGIPARRHLSVPEGHGKMPLLQLIGHVEYRVAFSLDGIPWEVTYGLGRELRRLAMLQLLLIGVQVLYLMGSMGENARVIRQTLRPLTEMAEKARTIQEEMNTSTYTAHGSSIECLAGAISSIDAGQLDRRISVDSAQNELKDLAQAINDMLTRINQSYQSQLRFVSDASHELRTPIAVIQGYANLLDRWGKHDEKALQESLNAIKSETEHMKVLVEQLLFLARGDSDTIKLHEVVFDSCDIIDEVIRETQLIDSSHVVHTKLDRPGYVKADPQLIKQAIRILVDNSLKFTPAGERIVLKVTKSEGVVRLVVQDNGIGIAPDDVPHVFDRFYRSDESRARKTGGAGLGLAIARWIIERHGGHFEVLSRVDIGTRITIVLPAAVENPGGTPQQKDSPRVLSLARK